ncbi:MAG: V-type ATP synthase subunit A [Thaumarchaeota archaeon]|nr:V-type ATP synthase subunit A [Nitrososphaerota archaeon]
MAVKGKVVWINGPAVKAEGMAEAKMYETVEVGQDKMVGEIIRITGDVAFIQVYESTSGLSPGEPVYGTGHPLSVSLGPGMMGTIYDGLQRPLDKIAEKSGAYIQRGVNITPLPMENSWKFRPSKKKGDEIEAGSILGVVKETPLVDHKILVPPTVSTAKVLDIVKEGNYSLEDTIATVQSSGKKLDLKMYHQWPVRKPRPYKERFDPEVPLLTGQRVIDTFFPIAKGGTGAIPGGFGTGKTVTLHQVAAWADSKVVLHVGCGERGNEMTEVLVKFPELKDPASGRPLMERTILVANVSNMPVAAREASVYTGVTMAEYYRDMGYDVVLVADSTSRWAEALREMSGRLEEMPAEEGYPSYLASRLAEFYERAGRVTALGSPERIGSVTLIGAVSPSGADFTEPVTTHTIRFIRTFWALDTRLAYSRHYPAINWMTSYSGYLDYIEKWWSKNVDKEWSHLRGEAYQILQREDALKEIVRLLGPEALPDEEKLVLDLARMLKIGFLQQSAYDEVDSYSSPEKQIRLLKIFVDFHHQALSALRGGTSLGDIRSIPIIPNILRAKFDIKSEELDKLDKLKEETSQAFKALSTKPEVKAVA